MRYLAMLCSPVWFLWDTLFGVRPSTIDSRALAFTPVLTKVTGLVSGSLIVTRARIYRAPVKKVSREGRPDHIYSEKKCHSLGVIGMREPKPGERVIEGQSFEIIKSEREIIPGVSVNPKDVLELLVTIENR